MRVLRLWYLYVVGGGGRWLSLSLSHVVVSCRPRCLRRCQVPSLLSSSLFWEPDLPSLSLVVAVVSVIVINYESVISIWSL